MNLVAPAVVLPSTNSILGKPSGPFARYGVMWPILYFFHLIPSGWIDRDHIIFKNILLLIHGTLVHKFIFH